MLKQYYTIYRQIQNYKCKLIGLPGTGVYEKSSCPE
jgi:hypothetical protein